LLYGKQEKAYNGITTLEFIKMHKKECGTVESSHIGLEKIPVLHKNKVKKTKRL